MTGTPHPPFHADQVGSLLRPAELAEARARAKRGEIDTAALREAQDRCIRDAVARQESIGLRSITDGEFRRDWWHIDFLAGFDGIEAYYGPATFGFGGIDEQPPLLKVTGKIRRTKPIFLDHFRFLKAATRGTPKMTIPAPAILHHRGGRDAVSREAYPDLDEMWEDVARAYREEIRDLASAGCTYLQLDDTSHAMLCDPKFRDAVRKRGDDPDVLVRTYGEAINKALEDRPAGLSVTMHTCRGNYKSAWVAEGGYDPVADAVFNGIRVDGFFLEFDSERAGGFEPLRFVPAGKTIVLGLVTTKTGELEAKDQLKRRIEEASRYVALEDLGLSPQCGFASTYHGNNLEMDSQWRKLERIVEVAREVWR